jgi:hypothetical protein
VTLLADAVVLKTNERKRLKLLSDDHPVIPALNIARLGVASGVRERVRGIGQALVSFSSTWRSTCHSESDVAC